MKDKNINRHKAKNVIALLGLVISLFFAYVTFYGWQNNYDRKNVVIVFFFLSLLPLALSLGHFLKILLKRIGARREDNNATREKKEKAKTVVKEVKEEIKNSTSEEKQETSTPPHPTNPQTDDEKKNVEDNGIQKGDNEVTQYADAEAESGKEKDSNLTPTEEPFTLSYYDTPEESEPVTENENAEDDNIPGQLLLDFDVSSGDDGENIENADDGEKKSVTEPVTEAPETVLAKPLVSSDDAPRVVDQRSKGVWWDKNLLEHCEEAFPKLNFKQPQGRTMLGSKWFIVTDATVAKDELEKCQREIEHRGGKIIEMLQPAVNHVLILTKTLPANIEDELKHYSTIKVLTKDDFEAVKAMGDSVKEENRWMFTPKLMFKIVEKALVTEEKEDGINYMFLAPDGEGFSAVYLDDKKEKKKIAWNGVDINALWSECGSLIENYVIVAPSPRKYLESLKKRLEDASLECGTLHYIDLIRWEQIYFAHESLEHLEDLKYVCNVLGMEEPKGEEEMADAVASIFMLFITDNLGCPKGLIEKI